MHSILSIIFKLIVFPSLLITIIVARLLLLQLIDEFIFVVTYVILLSVYY